MVDLLDLRLFEPVVGRAEICARIHHLFVEPQAVEIVGNIVVMLDRVAVELARVPCLAWPGAPAGGGKRGNETGDRVDCVAHMSLEIDLALNIRGAERSERGLHQAGQRLRAADMQHEFRGFAERVALAVP